MTSESSQTWFFYLPEGRSTSGVLAVSKKLGLAFRRRLRNPRTSLAVSSDRRGSVSCLLQCRPSKCRPSTRQHCGSRQILLFSVRRLLAFARSSNTFDCMLQRSELVKWRKDGRLLMRGRKGKLVVDRYIVQCRHNSVTKQKPNNKTKPNKKHKQNKPKHTTQNKPSRGKVAGRPVMWSR